MQPYLLNPRNEAVIAGREPYRDSAKLILPCVFLLATILLLVFALRETGRTRALVDGVDTVGTVTNLSVRHDGEGGDSYNVEYRYDASMNGRISTYFNKTTVPEKVYRRLAVGEPATVRYGASLPNVSKLAELVNWDNVALLWLGAGTCVLISGLLMIFHVRPAIRLTKMLREHGQMLPGRIVGAVLKGDGDGGYTLEIAYCFTSPGGARLDKRQLGYAWKKTAPPVDTPVTVLYADDRHFTLL